MKTSDLILLLSILILIACNGNRPSPPDGWVQKVNNDLVGRVTLAGMDRNCARTRGAHVVCEPLADTLEYKCYAVVSFLDSTPTERWEKECALLGSDTLVFDDGTFTYFYGSKSNP